jgi:hypothetical protein
MPTVSSLALPPPRNWQDFEDLCCDLWRGLWDDPGTQRNGRNGQAQAGVDVFGRPGRGAKWEGVQCKLRSDAATPLTRADIEAEVERARTFTPALSRFVIATTGSRDAAAQQAAREITEAQLQQGSFPVSVVAWEDILLELASFPGVLAKHYPGLPLIQSWFGQEASVIPGQSWMRVRQARRTLSSIVRMEEDYAAVFGGRSEEISTLDQFLNDAGRSWLLMLAPAGRGKTALMFRWVALVRERGEWDVTFYPFSLRYQTASADVALRTVEAALATFHGVALEEFAGDVEQLRYAVADLLRREPPAGRKLLLVLDGLDEAEVGGWEVGRDLFPRSLPARVKVVCSSRNPALWTRGNWLERLGWSASEVSFLDLGPLERRAASEILEAAGFAGNDELVAEVYRVSEGDPLTMRYTVEALQSGELSPGTLTAFPAGLTAFVEYWLSELDLEASRDDSVHLILGLLTVALAPLSWGDIEAMATEIPRRRAILRQAVRRVRRFVVGDGSPESGYALGHPRLREVFMDRLSPQELNDLRTRFVEYGRNEWMNRSQPLSDYVRMFWIRHLADAGEWALAEEVATGFAEGGPGLVQRWCKARFEAEGSYGGYMSDVDIVWKRAEQDGRSDLVLRCAVVIATLRTFSANLPGELLVDLVAVGTPEGRWRVTGALETIRQMPNGRQQALALKAVCEARCEVPAELLLDVACGILDERWRAAALGFVAPLLTERSREEAARIASRMANPAIRAEALCSLLPLLSVSMREAVQRQAEEAARAVDDRSSTVDALTSLARCVPEAEGLAIWEEALETAISIVEPASRWRALARVATGLPRDLVPRGVEGIRTLPVPGRRADVFHAMLERLPAEVQAEAWWDTFEAFASERSEAAFFGGESLLFGHEAWLASAAGGVHLPPADLRRWLERARDLEDPEARVLALTAIAPSLGEDLAMAVWPEVAEAIRSIVNRGRPSDAWRKAGAWGQVLPFMREEDRGRYAAEAIEASLDPLSCHGDERDAFCEIVAWLPEEDLPAALERARERGGAPLAKRLVNLGRRMGLGARRELLAEAVRAAQWIGDTEALGEILGGLARALPPVARDRGMQRARGLVSSTGRFAALRGFARTAPAETLVHLWAEVFETLAEIPNDWRRALAVEEVSSEFPSEFLDQAVQLGLTMRSADARGHALSALADRLPSDKALIVWRAVFEAGGSYLGPALSRLQAQLQPEAREKVWKKVLDASISLSYKFHRHLVLKGLAPFLPAGLVADALDAMNDPSEFDFESDRAAFLEGLFAHLPGDLWPRATAMARAAPPRSRARLLGALANSVSSEERDMLLEEAVNALEPQVGDFDRDYGIRKLAGILPLSLVPRALRIAGEIDDPEHRAAALLAFGARLPAQRLPATLGSALACRDWYGRGQLLRSLSPLLAEAIRADDNLAAASPGLWTEAVRRLARYGRRDLLLGLAALAPWSAALLSHEAAEGILEAILEAVSCWP